MNSAEKEQMTGEFANRFRAAEMAVLVGYQGITCADLTDLRKKLKPVNGKFAVVKNTLARRALSGTPGEGLKDLFSGPTAVIWTGEDPVGPAKILKEFAKGNEKFSVKGGILGESIVDAKTIDALAALPSRNQLLANLLALINAPATRLLQTINAPASSLARLLGAWKSEIEKKQE